MNLRKMQTRFCNLAVGDGKYVILNVPAWAKPEEEKNQESVEKQLYKSVKIVFILRPKCQGAFHVNSTPEIHQH